MERIGTRRIDSEVRRSGNPPRVKNNAGWYEFSSAVSLKVRARQIDPRQKDAALTMFSDWCEGTFVMEAISQPDFAVAAHYAARDDVDIRAGDALHAAACMRLGTTMCTLDAKLRAACEFLGIGTETL